MRKKNKLTLALALCSVSAAFAGLALSNTTVQATEQTETPVAVFAMKKGAAVRAVANEAGIRWTTNVTEAWATANIPAGAENVKYGTFVTSVNNVTVDGKIDVEKLTATTAEVQDLPCDVQPTYEDGTFTYYSSITYDNMSTWSNDDKNKAYATELIARSYVKYTDSEGKPQYKYATANDSARCMRAVALAACEETDEEKKLTPEEKDIVEDYFTKGTEESVALTDGYYETGRDVAESINPSSYTVAYDGAKKVGTVNDTTIVLDGLTLGKKYTLTLFDEDGNYTKTNEFQYVTKAVSSASFKTDLKFTANTAGYFALTQDIALSETWENAKKFSGTFDGNGFKITGLQGKGLFDTLAGSAVIKNVSIIDANLNSTSGAIARLNNTGVGGTVTIENVYVSLAAQLFSEAEVSSADYQTTAYSYKGGLIGYGSTSSDRELVVKNTVVYMPETMITACGFVYGYSNGGEVETENCTFIGGNGQAVGVNSGTTAATVTDTNSVYCDAVAAHKTHKANWSEMQKAAYNANHEYVQLGNADFKSYFKTATNQIIVLTEDVDLKGNIYGTANGPTFSGVLDGQGHKITGLNYTGTKNARGSLTNILSGSIKNVAIVGAKINPNTAAPESASVIAYLIKQHAYLENVYIEVTKLTDVATSAPIASNMIANVGLSLKNVVIYAHGEVGTSTCAAVASVASPCTIKTDNFVYIHDNANVTATNNAGESVHFEGTKAFKGASAKADFDAAVADETVTLTDFIKGVMYPTNN